MFSYSWNWASLKMRPVLHHVDSRELLRHGGTARVKHLQSDCLQATPRFPSDFSKVSVRLVQSFIWCRFMNKYCISMKFMIFIYTWNKRIYHLGYEYFHHHYTNSPKWPIPNWQYNMGILYKLQNWYSYAIPCYMAFVFVPKW